MQGVWQPTHLLIHCCIINYMLAVVAGKKLIFFHPSFKLSSLPTDNKDSANNNKSLPASVIKPIGWLTKKAQNAKGRPHSMHFLGTVTG